MRKLWPMLPALLALLTSSGLGAGPLARRDLGGFSMQLPAGVTQQAGGTDSHAGRLLGPGLWISYDRGLYSDPLLEREGAIDREESAVVVDGLPARLVRWQQPQPAPARYFVGLHLPQISSSVMGPIRLTLLAQVSEATQLDQAQALLLSLRVAR